MRSIIYTITNKVSFDRSSGGANQSFIDVVNNLKTVGYEVLVVTPGSSWIDPKFGDLNFYFDIFNDPHGAEGWFSSLQYEWLLNSPKPYCMLECALTACTIAPYGQKEQEDYLAQYSLRFFQKAIKNIFSSPLHYEKAIELLEASELPNVYLYIREIDTEKFYNRHHETRPIKYLALGALTRWKGIHTAIDRYGKDLTVAGYGNDPAVINLLPKANFIGHIDHEDLPLLYNDTENFVHLPICFDAFGRTAAEAALCGCNLICNERVGALSYSNINLSNPETYRISKKDFINMVRDLI